MSYGSSTEFLLIAEEDLVAEGLGETSLKQYVDLVIFVQKEVAKSNEWDFELISRQSVTTSQGLPAEVLVFTTGPANFLKFSRFVYVHESKIGFSASYFTLRGKYEALEPIIDYSFSTFAIQEATSPR